MFFAVKILNNTFIMRAFLVVIFLSGSTALFSQCPVSVDQASTLSAGELLRLKSGTIIRTTNPNSFIFQFDLLQCESGHFKLIMTTSSGHYLYSAPSRIHAEAWMNDPFPGRYYQHAIKPYPELWQHEDFDADRCRHVRGHGVRCKRFTYEIDGYCWQHTGS